MLVDAASLPTALGPEPAAALRGLSESEVLARRAQGQGNEFRLTTSRSYFQILRAHALSFINTVLFAIGIALVVMGRVDDAVLTAGMVVLNVIVGMGQESRAKRQLDRIALLTRPKAAVIRDGQERTVDPRELVLGDVLVVRPGDQIVVDGQVIGDGRLEVDESLLTGESDRILKHRGDPVYSGSFCMTGGGLYTAGKVGAASMANQITAGARAFRQIKTPLQVDVDFVVRVLVLLAAQLGILLALSFLNTSIPMVERVEVAAVIVALVPQGLFAMTTVTYAMGALRMAGRGALIQQINAVESLSNVNVLCLDKTGTLTTNSLKLEAIAPLGITPAELGRRLGDYVASLTTANRTAEAIGAAFPGTAGTVREEVPFASERKWGALALDTDALHGVYVLGAPELLGPSLQPGTDLGPEATAWPAQGLRVLLFAYQPEVVPLHADTDTPQLPDHLIALGLVCLRDELRPEAQTTLQGFAAAGVQLKIISGDNPQTVAALAQQAGLSADLRVVSGQDLAQMDDQQFAQAAAGGTIFGRITPQQKEKLVRTLRAQGHYVAMIGDGVNDVLSLKQAHLAIAMQSGSQATRGVADIVLLDDSFAVLPMAVQEGRRIIGGMQDVLRLVLTHTCYVALLILAAAIVGVAFPTTPKLRSLLTLLTVGLPTVAIAAWARPALPPPSILRSVLRFVLPAGFSVSVAGFAVYMGYLQMTGNVSLARSALTTVALLCGLVLVPFVEPPTPAWVAGDELSGDWRPTVLAVGLLVLYSVAMLLPPARAFFGIAPLPLPDFLAIGLGVTAWAFALRFAWRRRLFERLLSRNPS